MTKNEKLHEDLRAIKYTLTKIDNIKQLMNTMNRNFLDDKYWRNNNNIYDLINRYIHMQYIAIDIGKEALLIKANAKLSLEE